MGSVTIEATLVDGKGDGGTIKDGASTIQFTAARK